MGSAGRVLVFTGDGKGKTTAALGMALRAAGHGMRTLVIQFVKGVPSTGEIRAACNLPGLEIIQTGLGFLPPADSAEFVAHTEAAEKGLKLAHDAVTSGHYDIVVLDEVCYAVARGLLSERSVRGVIEKAPPHCCLVLTGRECPEDLLALADTVTRMQCVKHALEQGRPAQKGVEI